MGDSKELSLGRVLKDLREAKMLSLRDVEREKAISNAYLSQLEKDSIEKPSPHILYKLAELYGASYDYLMQKAGYFVPTQQQRGGRKQQVRSFALSALENLSREEEEALVEYLAFLRTRSRKKK